MCELLICQSKIFKGAKFSKMHKGKNDTAKNNPYQAKSSRGRKESANQCSVERLAVGSNRICFGTLSLHLDLQSSNRT